MLSKGGNLLNLNSSLIFINTSVIKLLNHTCLPIPLAPDPIRVQSCVCCLLLTNRNSMAVTSIFLSISLSN